MTIDELKERWICATEKAAAAARRFERSPSPETEREHEEAVARARNVFAAWILAHMLEMGVIGMN